MDPTRHGRGPPVGRDLPSLAEEHKRSAVRKCITASSERPSRAELCSAIASARATVSGAPHNSLRPRSSSWRSAARPSRSGSPAPGCTGSSVAGAADATTPLRRQSGGLAGRRSLSEMLTCGLSSRATPQRCRVGHGRRAAMCIGGPRRPAQAPRTPAERLDADETRWIRAVEALDRPSLVEEHVASRAAKVQDGEHGPALARPAPGALLGDRVRAGDRLPGAPHRAGSGPARRAKVRSGSGGRRRPRNRPRRSRRQRPGRCRRPYARRPTLEASAATHSMPRPPPRSALGRDTCA